MSQVAVLPHGWVLAKLDDAATIHDDLREPINADERAKRQGPYPYFGATGQVGWIDSFLMEGEYVLLGEDGAPFLDPLKPKAYRVDGKCWVNNHAHVLRGVAGLTNNRYLMHALNQVDYRGHANGTTRLKLTQGAMRKLPIPIAPLREQIRIVDKVEELLSDLDAGMAALERARANLKKYRAALLKAAVTGELTADWRAAHPQTELATKLLGRIVSERRRKWEVDQQAKFVTAGKAPPSRWKENYREPPGCDITALPDLPSSWCWASFGQCAFEVTVGHVGPMKDRYVSDGIPFLRSQNVRPLKFHHEGLKYISADFHELLSKSKLQCGELLVVRSGVNFGDACVYPQTEPAANCADLVITRLIPGVLPEFAAMFVNSPFGRYLVGVRRTGSAQPHFNIGAMEQSPFPLPPLREQKVIVAEVERQLSDCAATDNYIDASLKRAVRLRQSILKEAFAGRLVPQDASDEPASVLLERSRNARDPTDLKKINDKDNPARRHQRVRRQNPTQPKLFRENGGGSG